jgi:hypothetical protein
MYEVIQHAEVEVHPDLVKHRLEPSIERLTILTYHQGGPDSAQALGRTKRPSGEDILRLRGHLGLLSLPSSLQSRGTTPGDSKSLGGDSVLLREAGEASRLNRQLAVSAS